MTAFCSRRWVLFYAWTKQVAAASRNEPNERRLALAELERHQNNCKTCRAHLAAMSKLSSQAVHPEFTDAAV